MSEATQRMNVRNKPHIRRNDQVQVIAGESKGSRGRVLRIMPGGAKVVVEGVNLVWKHLKPSQERPRGGRVEREAPIAISNVMLLCQNRACEHHDRPVRTRVAVSADRGKDRVCVKCGRAILRQQ
jgi:large subunit ribosomal protein L24